MQNKGARCLLFLSCCMLLWFLWCGYNTLHTSSPYYAPRRRTYYYMLYMSQFIQSAAVVSVVKTRSALCPPVLYVGAS